MSEWMASKLQCHICTHRWGGVYPFEADEDALECPSCGAFNSDVIERLGPDQKAAVIKACGLDGPVEHEP